MNGVILDLNEVPPSDCTESSNSPRSYIFDLNYEPMVEEEVVTQRETLNNICENEEAISIAKRIEGGVLAVIIYNGFSYSLRLSSSLKLQELIVNVCNRWIDLDPLRVSFDASYGGISSKVVNDSDIFSIVVAAAVKGIDRVNLNVKCITVALEHDTVVSTSSGSSSSIIENGSLPQNKFLDMWEYAIKNVGQTFKCASDFRCALRRYTIHHGYEFNFKRNSSTRIKAVCRRKEETCCEWNISASKKYGLSEALVIKKLNNEHTCGIGNKNLRNENLSADVVRSVVGDVVRDRPDITPADIIDMFRRECGVTLSYYFAYRGLQLSRIENVGDEEASYQDLRWYIENLLQTNPGSYVKLEVNPETHKFSRIFVSFEACIYGVKFCRKFIALDGCHLSSKYQGTMLSATALNAGGGFFPFAMCVVDSEDDKNWEWFLGHLKIILGDVAGYTFISDRHHGLMKYVPRTFPRSHHSYCLWHLKNNFKLVFPSRFRKRDDALSLFSKVGLSMTDDEYATNLKELKNLGLDRCVEKFVQAAPVENWVNAYFPGVRYGLMSSNLAESYNSWIRAERGLPICSMIDHIRIKLMKQMSDRRELSRSWKTVLCPAVEKQLTEMVKICSKWKVVKSFDHVFEVFEERSYNVDLRLRDCSCNEWRVKGFPCNHAIVSILNDRKSVYDYVDKCFFTSSYRSSYSHAIFPIPTSEKMNSIGNVAAADLILPPDTKRGPGRPKKGRYESTGIFHGKRKKRRCGRCKKLVYHNRATCKAAIS